MCNLAVSREYMIKRNIYIYIPGLTYRFLIVHSSLKDANVLNGMPGNWQMKQIKQSSQHQERNQGKWRGKAFKMLPSSSTIAFLITGLNFPEKVLRIKKKRKERKSSKWPHELIGTGSYHVCAQHPLRKSMLFLPLSIRQQVYPDFRPVNWCQT